MDFNQIILAFQSEMRTNGITPPSDIFIDSKLHRFYVEGDKKGSKNGWYCAYPDGTPCAVFGSWKKGGYFKWSAKNKENMSSSEQNQQRDNIQRACKIRDELKAQEQHEAAERAGDLWSSYPDAVPNQLYLVKKRIFACYARQCGTELVLPVIDFGRKIWSLQYINELGAKRFLSKGAIKGHFMPVQYLPGEGEDKRILICEGFATGVTLAQKYPNACVIAACNADNLKPVAVSIRQNLPYAEIVLCLDDDRLNPENPGIYKGRAAAIASGASYSRPKWPDDAPEDLKDYNDLACWLTDKEKQNV